MSERKTPRTDKHAETWHTQEEWAEFAQELEQKLETALDALEQAESYLVERRIESRGVTGRTVVLPAIRKALEFRHV